ncbi:alkaline shock response membrane anchor protein AmaP [Streptomyces pluripotens]|uniref:Alkaline shock response membrane anchor protein AmaP n=1 Tax=Streptomyces pluripotens TaxID=1355015 RepID=A0A221P7H4_9ACTN|nr:MULTISPECIES: alkaline shock response membrane anchor protein AmaP [Streptomyces]ARP73993.1 alkaline shock response membrane anchor protein AmaP [Streptomyces pluripotens]ASN28253.1 alkaline shock response membrane anchor protein AmaP [Streptomyces pluripotens]KIE24601.1 membrane protein [Streptomyces sp. MUSC 125]MCH0558655.1 alkaline shock response membrane anchor protein AmaP [Streptomyces sp. MUM 16J]
MGSGSINRVLLALVGLVLLVLGGSVLAVGLGAPPPSWWIHTGPHDVLLSKAERTRWRDTDWWWPVVIAVLAVVLLLALWWLTAVLRRHRLTEILVDTGDGEGAVLRGRALESALAQDSARQEGVAHAEVLLQGRRTARRVRVRLQLEPNVDPATALNEFTAQALRHASRSAGWPSLSAEVRLRATKHRAERVS